MLVSVVIPTYNRFRYLLNAIDSVKKQTYSNIEIIVVNDSSTDQNYYSYDFTKLGQSIKIIHLIKNSKTKFGYPCAGYVRNQGINAASGKFIAFLDDDDIWLPKKIELQLWALANSNNRMVCTEGLIGNGPYDKNGIYKKYNGEHYKQDLENIYKIQKLPDIFDKKFIQIHNSIICSSVLVDKTLLDITNGFQELPNGQEDWDMWLRLLHYTDCTYLDEVLMYYDLDHGYGHGH